MDSRTYDTSDADKFRFEMDRDDWPVHVEGAVEAATRTPVVMITLQHAGVRMCQSFSAEEARQFAAYIVEVAETAEKSAASK